MDTPPSPLIKSEYFYFTTPTTSPPPKPTLLDSDLKLSLESNPKRSSMSSTKDSDVSGHPTLKLTGVEQLKPPGSDSNYLDWSWILEIHFAATDVDYIINDKPELAKARATFDRDNKAVCGVISRTINPINIRNVRHLKNDARGLWDSLKKAHQDSSAGGVMYWLRKLTLSRMVDDDLLTHLDNMAKTFERLSALVTAESPLTPDDIYSTSILTSLPQDWLSCVSSMMNEPRVDPSRLIDALKAEHLRRKTRADDVTALESASSAKPSNQAKGKPRQAGQPVRHCTYCNMDGHDLNRCGHVARLLENHKSSQNTSKPGVSSSRSNKKGHKQPDTVAKAGRTLAATLGGVDSTDDDDDFSGSEVEVTAGQAAISLSSGVASIPTGDANLDSGCSVSMTPDLSAVSFLKTNRTPVRLADHSLVEATHKGVSKLPINIDKSIPTLVVPALAEPLLSIAGLCDAGLTAVFTPTSCDIYNSKDFVLTGNMVGRGYRRGNLYYLPSEPVSSPSASFPPSQPPHAGSAFIDTSLLGYHWRLSHIGIKPLKKLLKIHGITPTVSNEIDVQQCQVCLQSKLHRRPFKSRSVYRSKTPGEVIHSDVGSYEVQSREGYKYFISFIDDCTKAVFLYPMKFKSESFSCFKIFRATFEKINNHIIKSLRTDNGGEYISKEFEKYLENSGIRHEPGPPHSPQLNGVAERTNRTISNLVRSSLISAHLPKSFWVDALRHAFHAHNHIPCNTPLGFKTPNSILGLPPININSLHPFGCLTYYKMPEETSKKLDQRGRASILLSYLSDGNGYRVWDLEKRTVVKSRDVTFIDTKFPYGSPLSKPSDPIIVELPWPISSDTSLQPLSPEKTATPDNEPSTNAQSPLSPSTLDLPPLDIPLQPRFDRRLTASIHAPGNTPCDKSAPSPQSSTTGIVPISLPPLPPSPVSTHSPHGPADSSSGRTTRPEPSRRSGRERKAPDRYGNWSKHVKADEDLDTPKTWRQLLKSPNKHRWLKAADDEFASLLGMNTWRLVPRPQKRKIIKSKWVFKIKRRPDRSIQKLKARLVAMGYSQIHGLDYDEIFSPTLRLETLRLICSLLAIRDWKGRQVDFKTAFLNGHLDHTVYMEQPPGFEDPIHPDWVCKLDRSLYGLKQSPRQWNAALHKALTDLGLSNSKYDPTLYFKTQNSTLIGALTTHVDDLAIVGEPHFVTNLIKALGEKFDIGADADLHHFLSLKITRDRPNRQVFLKQSHYIEEIQDRFLSTHTPVHTPTDTNFKLIHRRTPDDQKSSGPFNQLIGSLLWVSQCTRPDISFVVNRLSQHLRDPSEAHWQAAIRVLNYLVTTKDIRLRLGGKLNCSGFSDSDWAEDRDDRKSTSAYTYRIGDGAISWKSRKQATVSLSSTEAEYKALSDSCKEGLWLRHVLTELSLRPNTAIPLHVDNEGAEALAKNPEHHARTKHIHARYHFIRECVQLKEVELLHVSTKDMLADMLTKPLSRVLLEKHRLLFGLVP
jgi:transposase InsO family protein